MNYCSAIVVDFGSTNSGCARLDLGQGSTNYCEPIFIQGNQTYAKDNTWFFVRPDFWGRVISDYGQLTDSDFRILSREMPYTKEPNIVWGRQHIRAMADTIEEEGWIGFKYFKMNLYLNKNCEVGNQEVPIKEVVRLFLRILKIECLDCEKGRRNREVLSEEIQWGVTIPTIWGDRERKVMTEVASEVFGSHVRVLSEPEGPVLSGLIHSTGDGIFSLKKGRVNLVVDLGGGTTDITLLEETSDDADCEYPFKVIAATDGIGVGGNNVDEAFWNHILRVLSKDHSAPDGRRYDELNDTELKELLLTPFQKKLRSFIEMEDAWLEYKHGEKLQVQFPPSYLKWLRENGHNEVEATLTRIMIGVEDINVDELHKNVFQPTYEIIANKVHDFLKTNIDKIPKDASKCIVVKAGGLSLSNELRNLIDMQVNNLSLKFTSASLGADALKVSGSIMDGACIVLLNRKIINRKAPFNIFFDMGINLMALRNEYKEMGVNLSIGQLEELFERDAQNGAYTAEKAVPVGIKGEYLKDRSTPFVPANNAQERITFHFYGKEDGFVVLPHNNPECKLLGEITHETRGYKSFSFVIDFNEYPNNGNFHYFITSQENGEIMSEGNIPVQFSN